MGDDVVLGFAREAFDSPPPRAPWPPVPAPVVGADSDDEPAEPEPEPAPDVEAEAEAAEAPPDPPPPTRRRGRTPPPQPQAQPPLSRGLSQPDLDRLGQIISAGISRAVENLRDEVTANLRSLDERMALRLAQARSENIEDQATVAHQVAELNKRLSAVYHDLRQLLADRAPLVAKLEDATTVMGALQRSLGVNPTPVLGTSALRLHDTASGTARPLELREPGKVSLYVCGPTVYGPPHLGHGRHALVYDVLVRYLRWTGLDVTFVSNITDIDDNIINRANEEGRSTDQVVADYERVWWEAMDAIGVLRPDHTPHATEYVGQMVDLIQRLLDAGVAYTTAEGVYLRTERVPGYGALTPQSLESLRAGARVEVSEHKESALDFVLWKPSKEGEPRWSSPWGDGRPGWHTECVVMSLDLLGDGFDLHAGGQDLRFPHHENERAQAVVLGNKFAQHWIHHGFVEVGGEKMSKSLGNFTDLLDLVSWGDPRAYRLLVLQSHYRAPMEVSKDTVAAAGRALEGLDRFAERVAPKVAGIEADPGIIARFRERMDDDLDTPAATAALFDAVRRANAGNDLPAAAAALTIAGALGLELRRQAASVDDGAVELARQRDEARTARDWAKADNLRDELLAMGYEVADTPDGTSIRRR